MEVKEIDMSAIQLSKFNTRKDMNAGTEDTGLNDLANNIKKIGLLSPITVVKNKDNTFSLIAGQRRFLAIQKLGWAKIHAIIREITDDTDATIISLVENVHRADMNPIDKARAYKMIFEKYNSATKVSKETAVSASTVRKYLKLLNLAPSIQEKITTEGGSLTIGTLSKLGETFPPEEQEEVLEKIGSFTQKVQLEMLKRSEGDLDRMDSLKEQAMEGEFDVHICRGLRECKFIPEGQREFIEKTIDEYKRNHI